MDGVVRESLRRETIRQTPDICVKLQGKSIAGGGTKAQG